VLFPGNRNSFQLYLRRTLVPQTAFQLKGATFKTSSGNLFL